MNPYTAKKVDFSISFNIDGQSRALVGTSERLANTFKVTFQTKNSEGVWLELHVVKLFSKDHKQAVEKATARIIGCEPIGFVGIVAQG